MNFQSILRFFREKVNWHAVGIGVGITLVGAACVVLYNILNDLEPAKVYGALRRTPPHALVLAGLFVAAGYFTLTFYDYFALQRSGRKTFRTGSPRLPVSPAIPSATISGLPRFRAGRCATGFIRSTA